jgi:hypothetical protein
MRYEFVQMCVVHGHTFPASQECPGCVERRRRRWCIIGTDKGDQIHPALAPQLKVGESVSVIEIKEEK